MFVNLWNRERWIESGLMDGNGMAGEEDRWRGLEYGAGAGLCDTYRLHGGVRVDAFWEANSYKVKPFDGKVILDVIDS